MTYVLDLAKNLIACPSVTPVDAGALGLLKAELEKLGFSCWDLPFGEGKDRVENLFARYGEGSPHICFAGHTDVVPAGDENAWTYGPFNPTVKDGVLYGRGASDMKGAVAAFVAGIAAYLKDHKPSGSISLLITGDEEAEAVNGTVKVLEWMAENGHTPDACIVGEPTNPDHIGQEIKVGRRGSLNGTITVTGKQGHVAYQHLADNPMPRLIKILDAVASHQFDQGTDYFAPTNLEITTIDVGNPATNIIPASGRATFNIRYNETWTKATLSHKIVEIIEGVSDHYAIEFEGNAESFITDPHDNDIAAIVRDAVAQVSGKTPAYTTTGGTSDARFIVNYCPVIECGTVNKTIHQIDENTKISDLEDLTEIYRHVLVKYLD